MTRPPWPSQGMGPLPPLANATSPATLLVTLTAPKLLLKLIEPSRMLRSTLVELVPVYGPADLPPGPGPIPGAYETTPWKPPNTGEKYTALVWLPWSSQVPMPPRPIGVLRPTFENELFGLIRPKLLVIAPGSTTQLLPRAPPVSPKRNSPKPPLKYMNTSSIVLLELLPSNSICTPAVRPLSSVVEPLK